MSLGGLNGHPVLGARGIYQRFLGKGDNGGLNFSLNRLRTVTLDLGLKFQEQFPF